jgi:hypothetical protein
VATILLSAVVLVAPLPFASLGTMLAFGGALVVTAVMLAAIDVIRDQPADFDPEAFPVPIRVVRRWACWPSR